MQKRSAWSATACAGEAATIVGTRRGETLRGTSGRDVIVAGGGSDRIFGRGGDDLVCAGAGSDLIRGEGGSDVVFAGSGNDTLLGGGGLDLLEGGVGNDRLAGGAGQLNAAMFLTATAGVTANLATGRANGQGVDSLDGRINVLFGSVHRDRLIGDSGSNLFVPLAGRDRVEGRGGLDIGAYFFSPSSVAVDLALDQATGEGVDRLLSVEAAWGSVHDDVIRGDQRYNALFGSEGDDLLDGREADNYLDGGNGHDTCSRGPVKVSCEVSGDPVLPAPPASQVPTGPPPATPAPRPGAAGEQGSGGAKGVSVLSSELVCGSGQGEVYFKMPLTGVGYFRFFYRPVGASSWFNTWWYYLWTNTANGYSYSWWWDGAEWKLHDAGLTSHVDFFGNGVVIEAWEYSSYGGWGWVHLGYCETEYWPWGGLTFTGS